MMPTTVYHNLRLPPVLYVDTGTQTLLITKTNPDGLQESHIKVGDGQEQVQLQVPDVLLHQFMSMSADGFPHIVRRHPSFLQRTILCSVIHLAHTSAING